MKQVSIPVRIVAEQAAVDAIVADLLGNTEFDFEDPRRIDNPAEFRLDVAQIAAVVGTVHAVVIGGALVPAIRTMLATRKSGKIVIESPLGRVIFEPKDNLTEDEIREKLKKLTELQ